MENKEWLVTSLVNGKTDYKYVVAENREEGMNIVKNYYEKTNKQVNVLSANELNF